MYMSVVWALLGARARCTISWLAVLQDMLLDLLLCYQLSLALYLATRFDLLLVSCKTLLMLRS